MLETGIISPNMLKLFLDCPMKFYYRYVEQIPSPMPDKGFLTGKNIHSLAAYYLRNENISKFEKSLNEKEGTIWKALKSNKYLNYEVVGVEKSVSCKIGNFWIGGRLDAIVKDGNNYFILDYKTGGTKDDMTYDVQTMVYLTMCHYLIKDYDTLEFVYIDLKNFKENVIEYTPTLKTEYENRLISLCGEVQNFNIKTFTKKRDCKCEYQKICQMGLIK